MSSILQSDAWSTLQSALGRDTTVKTGDGWRYLAVIEPTRFGKRFYTPHGPVADSSSSLSSALDQLEADARAVNALAVRIEPSEHIDASALVSRGYIKAHHDVQPPDSVINDVSIPFDDILAGTPQGIRYTWRKNLSSGVTFTTSHEPDDIKDFLRLIHQVAERTGIRPHPDAYFKAIASTLFPIGAAGLFSAHINGTVVATVLYYSDGNTMAYAHAAADNDHRKLSPSTALVLYALQQAHETGHSTFDFFGVAPEGAPASNPWAGFTQFKLRFGGNRTHTVGTWEKPLRPLAYRVYRITLGFYSIANSIKKRLR